MGADQIKELRIERLGGLGDGLTAGDPSPLAVPYSAPGDLVEVEVQRRGRRRVGRLRRIIEPGPGRVEPACPHFGKCGGCRVQHVGHEAYARWKDGLWRAAMRHAGIDRHTFDAAQILALTTVERHSRRRARLAVRKGGVGFRAEKSHRIEPISQCPILEPSLLRTALAFAELPKLEGCELSLTLLDDGVEVVIHGLASPDYGALQDLADMAERLDLARLAYQHRSEAPLPIAHRREGIVAFGGVSVIVPPVPFLQATRQGEALLRDCAAKWLAGAERVADLFSGCGAFALPLVTERTDRRVLAVDRDGPAVAALSQAARKAGLEGRLTCETRDLFDDPLSGPVLEGLDGVVIDPPRAGARAQAEALAASSVNNVVAISCNPASFARDAAILLAGGYRLAAIVPLDQFLWTAHLELAAHFTRD